MIVGYCKIIRLNLQGSSLVSLLTISLNFHVLDKREQELHKSEVVIKVH